MMARPLQRELYKRTIHVAFPKKINLGEIGNCVVAVPFLHEQEMIAEVLNAFQKELDGLLRMREEYGQQKKGLMHKLLTGKIRVNTESSDHFPDVTKMVPECEEERVC